MRILSYYLSLSMLLFVKLEANMLLLFVDASVNKINDLF